MFEKYTEKARRVIFFARYEVSEHGASSIGTEHLLLGLLREDKALLSSGNQLHADYRNTPCVFAFCYCCDIEEQSRELWIPIKQVSGFVRVTHTRERKGQLFDYANARGVGKPVIPDRDTRKMPRAWQDRILALRSP